MVSVRITTISASVRNVRMETIHHGTVRRAAVEPTAFEHQVLINPIETSVASVVSTVVPFR